MKLLGNIIWLVFGGFMIAFEYLIAGAVLCLTIVGIPFGYQVMKLGLFALLPFGRMAVEDRQSTGCLSALFNVIWFFIGGLPILLTHLFWGLLFCITIIGIPFGMQHFKLMGLALTPFGRDIVSC